ncbi:hypothetical protein CC86DRAFT_92529 [Ophiobolus disseminans]|uniref:Uncharacterized protein n=1 Tax=Ophiobolus disseminans TaxID=1469910 RepID=A0A6A7AHG3_9PLEO|nr:hypothetical protein CC86DRAFT_92529 [Ophiobolus disseminans]
MSHDTLSTDIPPHLPSHTYRDIRSASFPSRKPRKPSCKSTRCRSCAAITLNTTRRARKQDLHHTLRRSTWEADLWNDSCVDEDYRSIDDMVQSRTLGRWMREAEEFDVWARRRVGEMRGIKEGGMGDGDNGMKVHTTRPTTLEDVHAHTLLSEVLVPNIRYIQWLGPGLIHLCGLWRFGDYKYAYYTCAPGAWSWRWVSCDRCVATCYRGCKPWVVCRCVGKDDMVGVLGHGRRVRLVEWGNERVWRAVLEEERKNLEEEDKMGREMRLVEEERGWDVVSVAASEEWSVISERSGFEVVR